MKSAAILLVALTVSVSDAFVVVQQQQQQHPVPLAAASSKVKFTRGLAAVVHDDDDVSNESSSTSSTNDAPFAWKQAATLSAAALAAVATTAEPALAAGPDWGIFEGRTLSMLHPAIMGGLFLYSVYTAFLGFQWRRQRTIGAEINDLKALLPPPPAEGEEVVEAGSELQLQIEALQQERKDLAAAGPRDQHFAQGALLAFLGTAFAIEGPLNTYARAGKLFPGPHLYAGAALVVVWSLAVGTIPSMQKGNDTARSIHIGANAAGIGLFVWQIISGIPIVFKVIEFTKWP